MKWVCHEGAWQGVGRASSAQGRSAGPPHERKRKVIGPLWSAVASAERWYCARHRFGSYTSIENQNETGQSTATWLGVKAPSTLRSAGAVHSLISSSLLLTYSRGKTPMSKGSTNQFLSVKKMAGLLSEKTCCKLAKVKPHRQVLVRFPWRRSRPKLP